MQKFIRAPDERELRHLRTYAARIRELDLPYNHYQYASIGTLLHWLSPPLPILPQLCKMKWYFDRKSCNMPPMAASGLVNSGNLRHFVFSLEGPPDPTDSAIVRDIYPILTNLQSFSLSTALPHEGRVMTPVIDDESLIWRLAQLQSLELNTRFTLTRPILVSLSELSLQSLTLKGFSTSICARFPRLFFPALRNLSLAATASDIAELVQSISLPNVTSVFLIMDIMDNRSSTLVDRATFLSIYSTFPASLRRVHIQLLSFKHEGDETFWVGPNAINFDDFVLPLQSLRNLRELTLRVQLASLVYEFMRLCNNNLKSLIPLWPELVLFDYHFHPSLCTWTPLRQDHPTLDTIFEFARAHPRLLHLRLPSVLTDGLPCGLDSIPAQEDAYPHLQGHGLLWFKVGWPWFVGGSGQSVSLEPIALAIDRAFPQVRREFQRRRTINAQNPWGYLEKELLELHVEEDVHGGS